MRSSPASIVKDLITMKKAAPAFLVGFLILSASLTVWALNTTSTEVGDAAAVERVLTSQTTVAPVSTTSTTATTAPSDSLPPDPVDPQPLVPQFTIGEHPEGHNRVPVALRIPAIEVDAPVRLAGVDGYGEMEVPNSVGDVGWYKYGSAPGEAGSAVLAAHVDLAGQGPGVFFELKSIESGDIIHIDFDDDTTLSYRAEVRTLYLKDDLPTEAIFSREGPPILTLITCGGGFNRSIRSYDSNVVVYAVPLADPPPTNPKDRS